MKYLVTARATITLHTEVENKEDAIFVAYSEIRANGELSYINIEITECSPSSLFDASDSGEPEIERMRRMQ